MNLDDALSTFLDESREMLGEMEHLLLMLEAQAELGAQDAEQLNALFRCAHTIKGSAGLFALEDVVAFTHIVENVLDRVRDGEVQLDRSLTALLISCRDHIATLIEAIGGEISSGIVAAGQVLVQQLRRYQSAPLGEGDDTQAQNENAQGPANNEGAGRGRWHISLRFAADVLRNGLDPLSFIRYLGTLGTLSTIPIADAFPASDEFDPESCYLGFEIDLDADTDKAAIEDVFEFVREDCALRILPPDSQPKDYLQLIRELPEDNLRLGELLVAGGALTRLELEAGVRQQKSEAGSDENRPVMEEVLARSAAVEVETPDTSLDKQQPVHDVRPRTNPYIRIRADKLDELINLVGELVIVGATAQVSAQRNGDPSTREAVATISSLVEAIRDGSLELRMVPIGETFQRFQRVVRDISRELGKDIALNISGADTELDKTVVEKIADPLTHLVRNAIDHGIEPVEQRRRAGKPHQGTVHLNAYHEAGSIVIEVSDDGGGLHRDRIVEKALERGAIQNADGLSDQEVLQLVFEPGLSTAAKVTNLSGRGVGMDVVKRNIEALRGTVELESEECVGTTVRVRLPLTLAIIDGFLMSAGEENYVVALDNVVECIEFQGGDEDLDRAFINLRGEVLPLVRLRDYFNLTSPPTRRESVLVVAQGRQKIGLVVDELIGEHQTVIKPMGNMFSDVKGLAGSTILGSGKVALILDVPALMQLAVRKEKKITDLRCSIFRRMIAEAEE